MAKAVVAALNANKNGFAVTSVYADGTDLTKVSNPVAGSLLIPVQGGFWSVGDDLPAEVICTGVAAILASISTIPWTQVKAAIN